MKKLLSLIITFALLIALSGCSAKSKSKVETINVGTGTQFPNICFIDKDGELTGYDVELVKEIDKRLPNYKFKFKTMNFSNLLVSLGQNKVDMVAHQMEKSDERSKKFLFNETPYSVFPLKLSVLKDNNEIKDPKDLKGKKVVVSASSNAVPVIKKVSKKQNDNFDIGYAGQGSNDTANQLKTGRADATVTTPFAVDFQNKTSPIKQKSVGPVLSNSKVYFMFNKQNKPLSKDVDKALKEIKEDGTLEKLSKKWLGENYAKSSY
ncbi:amino acid ABC transporter substrate-binding protein [Mammaliicoccus sciuri]|uniref:amino acid ABC transporter substrate-binding protein n=1 Tax=Mammaliicoccus sciuri TaxID=1296 RepID=UPI002271A2EC|nr:transporter substrate-binding domain-containing protein [Mammaliicoccus sciuri]MCY1048627.1 transporter substrate-binding domain-containing protein [Mammaliicoccus sciuri]MCY1051961.1 transporter substrate-binding domain-containing protein [Mammaliicoccus sciuri]